MNGDVLYLLETAVCKNKAAGCSGHGAGRPDFWGEPCSWCEKRQRAIAEIRAALSTIGESQ